MCLKQRIYRLIIVTAVAAATFFCPDKCSATTQQSPNREYQDRTDRYPVAEYEEIEPLDPVKRLKLKKQRERYDKDAPFISRPGPHDREIAFLPEWQFDFPALPIAKSDVIVIGEVLNAEAHRSLNKRNVFSSFEVAVHEVLQGNLPVRVITVQRVGGFVSFPNGQKVLFRLVANGMPTVGSRFVFFLNWQDEDYSILTAYELTPEGVVPLDRSQQFQVFQGRAETDFLDVLRKAISQGASRF